MFEFVRTHTRLLQGILVLLIFPSFVVFGIQGYSKFTEGGNATVGKVDGTAITQGEWDAAHQRQVQRVRAQQPNVDAKLFDTPEAKKETLDSIVRERVLLAAASKENFAVTDDRVQRMFLADPQFEGLRNPDGSVNKDILAAQGMSSEQFVQQVRQDIAMKQVVIGVTASALSPKSTDKIALDALLQHRDVQTVRFNAADYASKVAPTDADILAFYKDPSHESMFRAPEQATIDYVVLDLAALQKGVIVPEKDLRDYYDANASRYTVAEERRASHILVNAPKDAPAADRAKAKAKAEELLAQVRKAPATFADVAKKNSDDKGSAEKGGDLDFFGRGAMVKPFEDAAFAMRPGEISNVVESDFGYHIIKLDAVKGGDKAPFDKVRAGIETEVGKQLAQKRFAEVAEQFTNTVYEQADSLQPVLDKLKLTKQTAVVQRTPAPGATGALGSAKLLEAVFASDAVKNKRNTDAVEVGPNQLASARIVKYEPAHTRSLDEVKVLIREMVIVKQAAALARKEGEARLASVKAGQALDALPAAVSVSRLEPKDMPRPVIDAALRADAAKLPAVMGVDMGDQGYAVVRVLKVELPKAGSEEVARVQGGVQRALAQAEAIAYYDALKARYKVDIKAPKVSASDDAASGVQR